MKLSNETLDVLKNFAAINMNVLLKPGKKIKTMTPQKNLFAMASIQEELPCDIPIYDLNQFLATISLFENPNFSFKEKSVSISNDTGATASYFYASKEVITTPPEKDIVLPSIDVVFDLEQKVLQQALRAANVMGLPKLALVGSGGNVFLTATGQGGSKGGISGHVWQKEVGKSEKDFNMIYPTEILKLLPREYEVSISERKISCFKSKTDDVTYFLAAEQGSTFG